MGRNADAAEGGAAQPATRGYPESQAAPPILHVVASSHGGGAVYVRTLTAGLVWRGLRVAVAMPFDAGHVDRRDFEALGVDIHEWRQRHMLSLARILRATKPCLLHTHGSRAAVLTAIALRVSRLGTVPVVHSCHGLVTGFHAQPRRALQRAAEQLIARRSRAVLAGSSHERDLLIAQHIAPADKVFLLPQGVDTTAMRALPATVRGATRAQLGIDEHALVVITVCRLDRPRDFPTLLAAFARLATQRNDSRLLIVGDGPERAPIQERIRRLNLDNCVILAGLQRHPAPCYAAADIFVSTSYGWEALGIATIEAQAAGLPVVVTDAGGAAEAFAPEVSGILVPRQDADALANGLCRLAADAELRRGMGVAGQQHVATRFAVEPMVEAVQGIYERVLSDASPPSCCPSHIE